MRSADQQKLGVRPAPYLLVNGSAQAEVDGEVVEEALACISVNGQELATFMCSPTGLELLAIGFLYNEKLIDGLADVASIHLSNKDCVDVWLHQAIDLPLRKIVTAGCGGGVTFDDLSASYAPLESGLRISSTILAAHMKQLQIGAELYRRSRGIHTAVLADAENVLLQVEDIGRHNCIDKIAGAALTQGIDTQGKILLSSGRISSEMLNKARRLGVPLICSRTSPTSLSLQLAEAWNITIVAYLRGSQMRVYTSPERVSNQ